MEHPNLKYLKSWTLPHMFCPGCGAGQILNYFIYAVDQLDLNLDKLVTIGGVGCMSRAPAYLNTSAIHGIHGRNLPFATGIKLVRPELMVTVFSGDGDLVAIGGNHLIHAARRNINVKVICVNNFNYGMTGGQAGPTTPHGARATTTPYGNPELPFNLPYQLVASGANFVSRWSNLHVRQIKEDILYTYKKPGFTFIEVLSPCPIGFGKSNRIEDGLEEMELYRQRCVLMRDGDVRAEDLDIDLREDQPIYVGRFVDRDREAYRPVKI